MKAWRVHRHARPTEALQLDTIDVPEPGPNQVRVAVRSSVLNFNDIDGCYGRYKTVNPPLPYTAGMEVVGTVDAAGAGAKAWIGRRVMATPVGAFGGYAEFAIAGAEMTFEAPQALDDREAAAFFFPFHLAYLALHDRARLQPGETVLIHAAAGGVSSAAVQLAKAAGARVITTCGGPGKVAFCEEQGVDLALDYTAQDFFEPVMKATEGRGVDVVFDTVGGCVAEQSFRCTARNGRHLMVGFASGIETEDTGLVPRPLMFGNIALLGVLLAYTPSPIAVKEMTGFNLVPRQLGEEIHAALVRLLTDGAIRPVIGKTVSFNEIPAALEALEQRKTIGRTVVKL